MLNISDFWLLFSRVCVWLSLTLMKIRNIISKDLIHLVIRSCCLVCITLSEKKHAFSFLFENAGLLILLSLLCSWLFVSPIKMIAMKFKSMKLQDNYPKVALLTGCIILLSAFGITGIPLLYDLLHRCFFYYFKKFNANMNLKLHKPLCIFDLETTGINISKDRIVEICILKVFPDAIRESKTWLVNRKCLFLKNLVTFTESQTKW